MVDGRRRVAMVLSMASDDIKFVSDPTGQHELR